VTLRLNKCFFFFLATNSALFLALKAIFNAIKFLGSDYPVLRDKNSYSNTLLLKEDIIREQS
jgi:hypothetical protein